MKNGLNDDPKFIDKLLNNLKNHVDFVLNFGLKNYNISTMAVYSQLDDATKILMEIP